MSRISTRKQQARTTASPRFNRARKNNSSMNATKRPPLSSLGGHQFGTMRVHQSTPPLLQAKLKINTPGDRFEREADDIANRIVQSSDRSSLNGSNSPVGSLAPNGSVNVPSIQRRSVETSSCQAPPIVGDVLRSPGQPLDPAIRNSMERRFGHDFSQIKIHTNAKAAESARAVNAHAYTVGNNIVFGSGAFDTQTTPGKRLLAHELTHTIQQRASNSRTNPTLARKDKSYGSATTKRPIRVRASDGKLYVIPAGRKVGYTEDIKGVSYTISFLVGPKLVGGRQSRIHRSWLKDLKPAKKPERTPDLPKPDQLDLEKPSQSPDPHVPTGSLTLLGEKRVWVSENWNVYLPTKISATTFQNEAANIFYSTITKKYHDYNGRDYATENDARRALGMGTPRIKGTRDKDGKMRLEATAEGIYQRNLQMYRAVEEYYSVNIDTELPSSAPKEPEPPPQCNRECQIRYSTTFQEYWRRRKIEISERPQEQGGDPPDFRRGGGRRRPKRPKNTSDKRAAPTKGVSRKWPKHHPFPKYLGGAVDQTLRKIPRKLHYRFHSALDKFKGGKYARSKGAAHFKDVDKTEVIKDLTEFYKTAEGGAFKKYLPDFLKAVKESGY